MKTKILLLNQNKVCSSIDGILMEELVCRVIVAMETF